MGLIQRIRQILQILPDSLNQRVQKCIEIRKEERFVHGKKVEASYDAETDRILLWGRSDISDVDLVIVLMHEIGHFLYHQLLDEKIKKHWLKIHVVENLDFGLHKDYSVAHIPEEAFCCAFSLVGLEIWLEGHNMKIEAEKLKTKLDKKMPKASAFSRKVIKQEDFKGIFRTTVKRIRRWVEETTGPLD